MPASVVLSFSLVFFFQLYCPVVAALWRFGDCASCVNGGMLEQKREREKLSLVRASFPAWPLAKARERMTSNHMLDPICHEFANLFVGATVLLSLSLL